MILKRNLPYFIYNIVTLNIIILNIEKCQTITSECYQGCVKFLCITFFLLVFCVELMKLDIQF